MTFGELLADVLLLTKRPDLEDQTKVAIQAATLKAHQSDYYLNDLYEVPLQFSFAGYQQAINVASDLTKFRALKYVRKFDGTSLDPGIFFTLLDVEQTLDDYSRNKEDVAYMAGRVIQLRSSTEVQFIVVGYYANPDVAESTYSSWVATRHPYYIVYEAARTVFKLIAYDAQESAYGKMAAEQLRMIQMSNVESVGR